jgi:hypothetical protein
MNGKKAKLLRKVGKVDQTTKRLYHKLNHAERGVLGDFYKFSVEKQKLNQNQ